MGVFNRVLVIVAMAAAVAMMPAAASAAQVFAATSVWNAPIAGAEVVDPNSAPLVADLQRQRRAWASWINTTDNSTPIYTVSGAEPTSNVILDVANSPVLSSALVAVPIPVGARVSTGGDGNMVIWQPSTDTMWEFWHLVQKADGWHAAWGGKMTNVSTSPGYYRDRQTSSGQLFERWFWGAPATSLALAGGVIRIDELVAGRIDHALYLSIPEARKNVWALPAQRTDGILDSPSAIPEGARLRLDPTLDLTTIAMPRVTRILAEAAQRYGIIVNNTSASISFRAEDPSQYGENPYPSLFENQAPSRLLASFPWDRLQVLKMDLRTPSSSAAPPQSDGASGDGGATTSGDGGASTSGGGGATTSGGDGTTTSGDGSASATTPPGANSILSDARAGESIVGAVAPAIPGAASTAFFPGQRTITATGRGYFTFGLAGSPSGAHGAVSFATAKAVDIGRGRRRKLALGFSSFALSSAGTANVTVKLSRGNLMLLKHKRRLSVNATVAGGSATRTVTFVLKAAR